MLYLRHDGVAAMIDLFVSEPSPDASAARRASAHAWLQEMASKFADALTNSKLYPTTENGELLS